MMPKSACATLFYGMVKNHRPQTSITISKPDTTSQINKGKAMVAAVKVLVIIPFPVKVLL